MQKKGRKKERGENEYNLSFDFDVIHLFSI
jgi:hypothetical protein